MHANAPLLVGQLFMQASDRFLASSICKGPYARHRAATLGEPWVFLCDGVSAEKMDNLGKAASNMAHWLRLRVHRDRRVILVRDICNIPAFARIAAAMTGARIQEQMSRPMIRQGCERVCVTVITEYSHCVLRSSPMQAYRVPLHVAE